MNSTFNPTIARLIGIGIIILLIASGCASAASPSPSPLPPTPIPPTPTPIPPTPEPAPDRIGLVQAYEEAYNQHDLEGVTALFADDAMVQNAWINGVYKDDIKNRHDFNFGVNSTIQNSDCSLVKDTVTCKAVTWDDCITAAGLDGFHFTSVEYVFEDMKIYRINGPITSEDSQANNGFMNAMFFWSPANRPEENAKMYDSNNNLISNHETGMIVSKLCQEYAAENP